MKNNSKKVQKKVQQAKNKKPNSLEKRKTTLKAKAGIIFSLFVVIGFIVGVVTLNLNRMKEPIDPEIARSMTYDQVQDGDEDVSGTNYVKFEAFFLRDLNGDGNAEGIRGMSREIGQDDTLYMELNVLTNGYLEDGVITINSENFYLQRVRLPKVH